MSNNNQRIGVAILAAAGIMGAATVYFVKKRNQKKEEKKKKALEEQRKKEQDEKIEEEKAIATGPSSESLATRERPAEPVEPVEPAKPAPSVAEATAVKEKPNPNAYFEDYNRGKSLFNEKKYAEAAEAFTASIEKCPANSNQLKMLIYSRSSCYRKLERMEDAITDLTECIRLDSKYAHGYKARASAYASVKKYEEAANDYAMVYMLDMISNKSQVPPEGMDVVIQELSKEAAAKEIKRREEDPDYVFQLPSSQFCAFYFSTVCSEEKNYNNVKEHTIEELNEKIAKKQETETTSMGDLYYMRGGYYKNNKLYEKAWSDFKEAIKEENKCHFQYKAVLDVASFTALSGNTKKACMMYETLYKEMKTVNLLVKYASCLLELKDEKYKDVFSEAVQLFPKECDSYFHQGQMLFINGDYDGAIKTLQHAIDLNKRFAIGYVQLAFCYGSKDNTAKAMEYMKRAMNCNYQQAQVCNHYGEIYMMTNELQEAISMFRKSHEYDASWAYPYVNEASIALQTSQDYISAQTLLKKAIAVDPTCVTAYIQLANLHMMLQEWDKTNEMLDMALQRSHTESDLVQVYSSIVSVKSQSKAVEVFQKMMKQEV